MTAWQAAAAPVSRGRARWDLERQVRLVAGSIVLAAVLLGVGGPAPVKWLAGAIGAGLTVAALTDTCAMGMLLARLPYNRGARSDLDSVIQVAGRRPAVTATRASAAAAGRSGASGGRGPKPAGHTPRGAAGDLPIPQRTPR